MAAASPYTPEYSEELLALVLSLYREEVAPVLGELRLSKMLDLLEVAQWNLEQYHKQLASGNHIPLLKHYVVGLLYLYYVVPTSIQFQIKNKNYEVYVALKQLYERETHMSNVRSVVADYISYINDQTLLSQQLASLEIKNRTKRSSTLPSSTLESDLAQYLKPPSINSDKSQNQSLHGSSRKQSTTDLDSLASANSSVVEDLWSPPELDPNDQLKLATDHDIGSTDELSIPPVPSFPPPVPTNPQQEVPYTASQHRFSAPQMRLQHAKSFPTGDEEDDVHTEIPDFRTIPEDRYKEFFEPKGGHRKDSYHSIVAEDDEGALGVPTISTKAMYELLKEGVMSCLIFDVRPLKRFNINHIHFQNLINVDPSLVLNSESFQEFQDVVGSVVERESFVMFRNMSKYDVVVVYTDNKTSLSTEQGILGKFVSLLAERKIKSRVLRGGFDSWTKYLSKSDIRSSDLKFVAKQPYIVPLPPSMPPPPVPETGVSPRSTRESTPVSHHETTSRIPPIPQVAPPVPPHHMTYPKVYEHQHQSRPYPLQQSFYNSAHSSSGPYFQAPTPPPPSPPPPPPPQVYPQYPQQQGTVYARPQAGTPQQYPHPVQRKHYQQRLDSSYIPTIQRNPNPFTHLSITGLRNMGSTCYINSMLQCLFATNMFRQMLVDYKFQEYTNSKFQKPPLSPALANLFEKMYLNGGCSIVPSRFLRTCIQLRPDLRIPSEQQDTQEFLMFMLDHLHDELSNSEAVVNDYPELMEHADCGGEYEKWFEGLIKQGFSPISKIFQGQLQDSLQCKACGYKSSNYSTFYMLSLSIPKSTNLLRKQKKVALEECIEMFTNDEILTGDNAWDCPKCSKKREQLTSVMSNDSVASMPKERKHRLHFSNNFRFRGRSSSPAPKKDKDKDKESRWKKSSGLHAPSGGSTSETDNVVSHQRNKSITVKSLTFVVLPPVLIVHLSRFLFYDISQKDTTIVQYPLILEIPHKGETVRYKLFGVVNHSGTLKSGHYTSIANKSLDHDLVHPNWYYFDDENVKLTDHGSLSGKDASHMSSSEVYVLFYEKIE